jgi:uncharacterized phage-associated protein
VVELPRKDAFPHSLRQELEVVMASVHDVAAYILKRRGPVTAMKLQKLIYYAQAWGLVWDEEPLFPERIEAWANGPVVKELYDVYRGQFRVSEPKYGDPDLLTEEQVDTVDSILKFYGKMSSQQLSDLTHREDPWRDARKGLEPGERGHREITHESMAEYYGSL